MKKKFKVFLQDLDLFSKPHTLRFNGRENFSTKGGIVMTMIVLFVTFISFIYLVNDLYQQRVPFIFQKTEQLGSVSPLSFGPDNFFISAILINYVNGQILKNTPEKTYYTVNFQFIDVRILPNVGGNVGYNQTIKNISSQFCDLSKIDSKMYPAEGQDKVLTQAYCPIYEQWSQTDLYGTQQQSNFSLFSLDVQKCTNGTVGIVCAPQSEIDKMISTAAVVVKYTNYVQDQSLSNPYVPILRNDQYIITPNTTQYVQSFYKNSLTKTTSNFFYYFGKEHIVNAIQFSSNSIKQRQTSSVSDPELLKFYIYLTSEQQITIRTYSNILNVFGNIGGLFNIFIIILKLVFKPIIMFYQKLQLVNVWFYYQKPKDDAKGDTKQIDVQIIINIQQKNSPYTPYIMNSQNLQPNLNLDQKIQDISDQQRKQLINQGMKEISSKIDIQTYLHSLQEIENLKAILLTEEQRTLMKFIMKPKLISMQEQISKTVLQTSVTQSNLLPRDDFLQKIRPIFKFEAERDDQFINLLTSYQQVTYDVQINPTNERILLLLDPDLIRKLEEAIKYDKYIINLRQNSSKTLVSINKSIHLPCFNEIQYKLDVSEQIDSSQSPFTIRSQKLESQSKKRNFSYSKSPDRGGSSLFKNF